MRIILLVLCGVCGNYGEYSTTIQDSNNVVTFSVRITDYKAQCKSSKKELIVEEGRKVILNATPVNYMPQNNKTDEFRRVKCKYINGSGEHDLGEEYIMQQHTSAWKEEHTVTKDMYGTWTCTLKYNKNTENGIIYPVDTQNSYSYVICNVTIKKPDVPTGEKADMAIQNRESNEMWYIIGGVGVVVLFIIIGQTVALCYFKRKAQPRTIDIMTPPRRLDRGDRARYSAPPRKISKSSARAQADTDSHIYEMVGINGLYNKSSDLNPETDTEKKNKTRPPLPLPHEIPKPVLTETLSRNKPSPLTSMPSTSSLNSTSSGSTLISKNKGKELPPPPGLRKAPARPPKQIDESIPGSLRRRPAMPAPLPAPVTVSVPASAKSGSTPETSSTKSTKSELKNIFKKRNVGKDTPTPSPAVTSKMKEPPKVQAKPNKLAKPKTQKQPPNVSTKPAAKPVNQSNQIKLILPKIEASLTSPKPLVPKTTESTSSPIKPPPPVKKPSQIVSQKPVSQKSVTQSTPKSVQMNRPLPTPQSARDLPPEPISPHPIPSMPIYQSPDEDLSQDTDDDEEWTYEPLEDYNIYNI